MDTEKSFSKLNLSKALMMRRMLWGAAIGLALIIIFLLAAGGKGNPNWTEYWMLKPLIVVPLAGAMGGAFYHFLDYWRVQLKWNHTLILIASFMAFIIALWLGMVLGLNGTYWN